MSLKAFSEAPSPPPQGGILPLSLPALHCRLLLSEEQLLSACRLSSSLSKQLWPESAAVYREILLPP